MFQSSQKKKKLHMPTSRQDTKHLEAAAESCDTLYDAHVADII